MRACWIQIAKNIQNEGLLEFVHVRRIAEVVMMVDIISFYSFSSLFWSELLWVLTNVASSACTRLFGRIMVVMMVRPEVGVRKWLFGVLNGEGA
ncbi:hypothetical protein Hanom_Chr17g01561571 [Helianthus anomalus]